MAFGIYSTIGATMVARSFDSRAAAAAANIANTNDIICVRFGGLECFYEYSVDGKALTTGDGKKWKPLTGFPAYMEHYGILPAAVKNGALDDVTNKVKDAVSEINGRLVLTGWFRIRYGVVIPKTCQIEVRGGYHMGGFSIRWSTSSGYDNGSPTDSVISFSGGEPTADMPGFSMWFEQPTPVPDPSIGDTTGRSKLRQYPRAVDLSDATRGRIEALRIEMCWNGLFGSASPGNPGGLEINTLEISAFNEWANFSGGLDFCKFERIHVWPFGFPSPGNAWRKVAEAQPPKGIFNSMDGVAIDTCQIFIGTLELSSSATGRLPIQINSVALDGPWSRLVLGQGASQIGQVYSTKNADAPPTSPDIVCYSGRNHQIGRLLTTSHADASVHVHTNGRLSIGEWNARHINPTRRAGIVEGGAELSIGKLYVEAHGADGQARTGAFVRQVATGKLVIDRITVNEAIVHSGHPLVEYTSDNAVNFIDARALPSAYTISVPASRPLGTYIARGLPTVTEGVVARRNTAAPHVISGGTSASEGANLELYGNGHAYLDADRVLIRSQPGAVTMVDINPVNGRFYANLPVYANNAAAVSGGLGVGDLYKTATGEVRIRL